MVFVLFNESKDKRAFKTFFFLTRLLENNYNEKNMFGDQELN